MKQYHCSDSEVKKFLARPIMVTLPSSDCCQIRMHVRLQRFYFGKHGIVIIELHLV